MHRRSGSRVKGHYRNGKWISSHYRKGTYVADYTKSNVYKKPRDRTTILYLSKDEEKNRDRNIYILTGLEREKNRIKPPVYETYFKGTFEEELAYNRSHRLWSITNHSVDIAEKYLARVIGTDEARTFRVYLDKEYDDLLAKYTNLPFMDNSEEREAKRRKVNIEEREAKRRKINIEGTKENRPSILMQIKSLFMGR